MIVSEVSYITLLFIRFPRKRNKKYNKKNCERVKFPLHDYTVKKNCLKSIFIFCN